MIICGIDPGLSGAVVFFDTVSRELDIYDMPTVEVLRSGKRKRELSPQLLSNILSGHKITAAYLERVNAMSGQGVSSVFSFGRSSGIVEGILAAYDITTTLVTPQAWQKTMDVRGGKDGSRERAMQIFPAYAGMFARVKDDGRADAALIAAYGERIMK
jgi:crossover junction endodeoxyribonuclease RuvC